MRVVLLAAAASLAAIGALGAPAAPAEAQDGTFTPRPPGFHGDFGRHHRDGFRHDRRRHSRHGFDGDVFIGDWPRQGDSAWRADSFNDWWHERPWRSSPAWVRSNQNCERLYWSGGGWRC